MLHGRHDRKNETGSRSRHQIDPMRLARNQQNNWRTQPCRLERFRI